MANGHIEIHDPFNGHNGTANRTESDQKSTSNSESTEDMVEFRILMAYAQRRMPKQPKDLSGQDPSSRPNGSSNTNGSPSRQSEEITAEKKKKKKKIWKRLPKVLTCLKPQTKEEDKYYSFPVPEDEEDHDDLFRRGTVQEDDLEHVASRLTEISDQLHFGPPELEVDAPDDDVERVIGLLLREAGDRLYEQELKDTSIAAELLGNYSFFEQVIVTLFSRMGLSTSNPETLGPTVSTKTQIAVTCEATSRLSVLDTLPTNRLLGHGARYLKTHFSFWAEQQGGYEKAFEDDDDDDDEVH